MNLKQRMLIQRVIWIILGMTVWLVFLLLGVHTMNTPGEF
jgi:hypothetical protein